MSNEDMKDAILVAVVRVALWVAGLLYLTEWLQ